MSASPAPTADRAPRAPQQERGQRRVEQILEAAEQVIAEYGVGGATMQLIADRAGSSVGSLYHFFPNKEAIVEALGAHYAQLVQQANEAAMPLTMVHLPVDALFERILDGQMQLLERTPAFDAVHDAMHRNCPAIYDALNQALVGHVGQFLALRYPTMPEHARATSAMVSVAMVHAMVELAGRLPAEYRVSVIKESKSMLTRHYGALDAQYGAR